MNAKAKLDRRLGGVGGEWQLQGDYSPPRGTLELVVHDHENAFAARLQLNGDAVDLVGIHRHSSVHIGVPQGMAVLFPKRLQLRPFLGGHYDAQNSMIDPEHFDPCLDAVDVRGADGYSLLHAISALLAGSVAD